MKNVIVSDMPDSVPSAQSGRMIAWLLVSLAIVIAIVAYASLWLSRQRPAAPEAPALPESEAIVSDHFAPPRCAQGTAFSSVTTALEHPHRVCALTVHEGSVARVAENVEALRNMKILVVAHQNLTSLPVALTQLPELTILDLSNNQLTSLPPEITNLPKLEYLRLQGNNIGPEEISELRAALPQVLMEY